MTKPRLLLLIIICSICFKATADQRIIIRQSEMSQAESDIHALNKWTAGTIVSENSIKQFGIDRCFVIEKISDEVFNRMYNKSYKADCTIPRDDLRYLKILHRNLKGEILLGEMVCNKKIAKDLIDIFKQLYDASYPIERMV
ncbi:MAG: M15 family peptidase, partial [Prevotella sp.]